MFLAKIEAKLTSFYWTTKKISTGYRIAVRKRGFNNPYSAGQRDEIGYIHVVPNVFAKGFYSILNVEILPEFQRQGLGSDLYRKAASEVKKHGGKGLISFKDERTPEATKVWKSLKGTKQKDGVWILE